MSETFPTKANQLLALLARGGRALVSAADANEAADRFLAVIHAFLPEAATAIVLAYDKPAEMLRVLATDGPDSDRFAARTFSLVALPEPLRLAMLDQQAAGSWRELVDFPTAGVVAGPPASRRNVRGLPLVARQRPVGLLLIISPVPLAWSPAIDSAVISLACHLASLLEVATLTGTLARQENERAALMAILSHELRTPLTAIRGFSEMIRDEEASPEETRLYAASIHRSAKRLNRMISELVDLYRLETGRLTLHIEPVDLNGVAALVVQEFQTDHPEQRFAVRLDPAAPRVLADLERLQQAITGLVARALENASRDGPVEIETGQNGQMAYLRVRDRGAGMSEAALRHLFDRFNGGLSLPLARQIALRHGGQLWAESRPDTGTVFHLTLPLVPVTG